MKLYFMKQSALEYMKANMGSLYKNYYQFDSPSWIEELFDYDPFELFDAIPDFELTSLSLTPGEIDFNNCKILYTKLKELSDSQASDERLWAGLCNKTFYPYMRERWKYARRHLKKTADDSSAVLLRYFFKNAGRSGMLRNSLARCWWVGRLTYSDKFTNPWELLDALGPEDIISKISDIFFSNTYSSNGEILEGFCLGLKFYRDKGIYVSTRDHIRPLAQYLNALGGGILLDMLSAEEIRKLVIERLGILIKGDDSGLVVDISDEADSAGDAEDLTDEDLVEEVSLDFAEYLDSLEVTVSIDLDKVLGELTAVEYGCDIHIRKLPDDTFYISRMPAAGEKLIMLQKAFLGKPIGYVWRYQGKDYEIVDIRRR